MDAILNQIHVNCSKASNMKAVADQSGKASAALHPYTHYVDGTPGHQSILDSHANSGVNALIYIGVVLLLYIIFMSFIVVKYVLIKSHCKNQNPTTPYYCGGPQHFRYGGGTTTTTGTTTLGGASVSGYGAGGPTSVFIEGDETPPEIRFIETEL